MTERKPSRKTRFLIIGAGPTGLGAGYRLKELGVDDFVIVERDRHAGGLASSYRDSQGFTWDIGGHVQFSHYDYFDELMVRALGKDGWLSHERESWAWMYGRFVPYPVQNNIRYFPKDVLDRCLKDLKGINENPAATRPSNFGEWIDRVFGNGLAEAFMRPYNYKVWAFQPEKMAYQWIGERVSVTSYDRVAENVRLGKDDLSWGPNNRFQFPKHGGTGAIWTRVADMIGDKHFLFGASLDRIDPVKKRVTLSNSETIEYEAMLSTIPLDHLSTLIETGIGRSNPTLARARSLKHSTSHIVGVGLKGSPKDELKKKCWMYFPEGDCPFYRVTVFSNYSPNNVPDIKTHWSLMTETSESTDKVVDREKLIESTIQGCLNTKLIESRDQVVSTWVYSAEYGYPTPSIDRDSILAAAVPEAEKYSIYPRGRFGGWKYEVSNQDHSLMQGVEWANRMIRSEPEITYFDPARVNAPRSAPSKK